MPHGSSNTTIGVNKARIAPGHSRRFEPLTLALTMRGSITHLTTGLVRFETNLFQHLETGRRPSGVVDVGRLLLGLLDVRNRVVGHDVDVEMSRFGRRC